MFNSQTNERAVCISYNDQWNCWKQIEKDFRALLLKSPALRFDSHQGTPIFCELSSIKFLPEKQIPADQLSPTGDSSLKADKKKSYNSSHKVDPYASVHDKPFLRIFLAGGDDYKEIKPRVTEWMKNVGDYDEFLLVHIASKESGFFQRSVASSVKSDFTKHKIDRNWAFNFLTRGRRRYCNPNFMLDAFGARFSVVTIRTFGDRSTAMDEAVMKVREGIVRAGQRMITEYSNRMKALDLERSASSFNFLSFFALKEGLSFVYEALKLPDMALGIYDELEVLFGQRNLEIWQTHFESFGGNQVGDDSGSILDFAKKPYRQLLLNNQLTEFDFRQYLFGRQCHFAFILHLPTQVLTRGIKFVASMEDSLKKNGSKPLFIHAWCFGAYMDLAEACKANNQTTSPDSTLEYILGDVYWNAITKLDILGAQFELLPASTFFVTQATRMEPLVAESLPESYSQTSQGLKPSKSAALLKAFSNATGGIAAGPASPNKPSSIKIEYEANQFTSPLKTKKNHHTMVVDDTPDEKSMTNAMEGTIPNDIPTAAAEEPLVTAVLSQPTAPISSALRQNQNETSAVQSTPGEDVSSGNQVIRDPAELLILRDDLEKIKVGLNTLGDELVKLKSDGDSNQKSKNNIMDLEDIKDALGMKSETPPPVISPIVTALVVTMPDAPTLSIEADESVKTKRDQRGKSPMKRVIHSRHSSVGEDIALDEEYLGDDDESNSHESVKSPGLPAVVEEDKVHGVCTFQELQMMLLTEMADEQIRTALADAINASEADRQLISDPENGSVFALTYLKACNLLADDIDATPLLEIVSRSDKLTSLRSPLVHFIYGKAEQRTESESGTENSTISANDIQTINGELIAQATSTEVSNIEKKAPTVVQSKSVPPGIFTFKTTIGPNYNENSPSSPTSSIDTSNSHYQAETKPSNTKELSSSDEKKIPVTSSRRSHFRNLSIGKDFGDSGDGPQLLQYEGVSITHPFLTYALTNSNEFDKLYKSIALKSNSAFTFVRRSRSSVRVKMALGNLAFARGHFQEALKHFDEELVDVFDYEGWGKMLFTLYNKTAECHRQLGNLTAYCSTLLLLQCPYSSAHATLGQRMYFQQESMSILANLDHPTLITFHTDDPRQELFSLSLTIASNPHLPDLKIGDLQFHHQLSNHQFTTDGLVLIFAKFRSNFASFVRLDKIMLTFQAVTKSRKPRYFHFVVTDVGLNPGANVVRFSDFLPKGKWHFISYTSIINQLTITTNCLPVSKNPKPSTFVVLNVKKSITTTSIKIASPTCLILGCKQFLRVKIASGEDTITSATIPISTDRDIVRIPDTIIKDANLKVTEETDNTQDQNDATHFSPSTASKPMLGNPQTSAATQLEVFVKNHVISLPTLPRKSVLEFFLPIMASPASQRDDGQLSPISKDISLDMSFVNISREKKVATTTAQLTWVAPLKFCHNVTFSSPSSQSFFLAITLTNQSTSPIQILSHDAVTGSDLNLVQDFNSALGTAKTLLEPNDFTTILFAVSFANSSKPFNPYLITANTSSETKEPGNWVQLSVNTASCTDNGTSSAESTAQYEYIMDIEHPLPLYKVDLKFETPMVVGHSYPMEISFFVHNSLSVSNPSYGSYYRLQHDPAQWLISGKSYGRLKSGSSQTKLGLVPLSPSSILPTVVIEQYKNIKDSKSRSVVQAENISFTFSNGKLEIKPVLFVTSVCREVVSE